MSEAPTLVVGLGLTGAAIARALIARNEAVVVVDDRPTAQKRTLAAEIGADFVEAPNAAVLATLVDECFVVAPSPGISEDHPVFALAEEAGKSVVGDFDLAAMWDDRPVVAITGTDGKTTVTTMVTEILTAGGHRTVAAGNTDVPLVSAIDDARTDAFVVEASSFRLSHIRDFAPQVALWLNFSPDHLDVHRDLASYEESKARIWSAMAPEALAIGNAEDPVVAAHLENAPCRTQTFGLNDGDYRVVEGRLCGPDDRTLMAVEDLSRSHPHDVANALAAWAMASGFGVADEVVAEVLKEFQGLPHRVSDVATIDGVRWVDDSKATVPHATLAAVRAFSSVVLLAGGRNKGISLQELGEAADHLRAVVAFGEAGPEVAKVFGDDVPVKLAESMDVAVELAAGLAQDGDVVLLSPGCASFDQYRSYAERGDHFAALVRDRAEGARVTAPAAAVGTAVAVESVDAVHAAESDEDAPLVTDHGAPSGSGAGR
jgi:UDP-N-acetylmuramoylalanine--D-glutamate ligase